MNQSTPNGMAAVLRLAYEEAVRLRHFYIGTEHQLFGLLQHGDPDVLRVLADAGASVDEVRTALLNALPAGQAEEIGPGTELPYTARAKRVINFASREAEAAGAGLPRPLHLLKGILLEKQNVAAHVLRSFGIVDV
jgi:ATP-dependent Clp protease ATP-binding subunit ClpC